MTTYIDATTLLPQNLGEIYSDRNIRISGEVRTITSSSIEINTATGLTVHCTPIDGGSEAITTVAGGVYTLAVGSSMWVKINRLSSASPISATPEFYTVGNQPKSRKDYIQLFYRTADSVVASVSSFLIYSGAVYTRLGYGVGQRVYDAIVGDTAADPHATHSDLQLAINDVATVVGTAGGRILIKKMCLISTTIVTPALKPMKLHFSGYGTGLQADEATTGIRFGAIGCQLVGFGQITGFTTAGVDLNGQVGCRLEMVFNNPSPSVNILFGSVSSQQVSFEGSYGLSETSHIETSLIHGTLARWHNTKKRWEPVAGITVDDAGKLTSTGTIQGQTIIGTTVIGAVYQ